MVKGRRRIFERARVSGEQCGAFGSAAHDRPEPPSCNGRGCGWIAERDARTTPSCVARSGEGQSPLCGRPARTTRCRAWGRRPQAPSTSSGKQAPLTVPADSFRSGRLLHRFQYTCYYSRVKGLRKCCGEFNRILGFEIRYTAAHVSTLSCCKCWSSNALKCAIWALQLRNRPKAVRRMKPAM